LLNSDIARRVATLFPEVVDVEVVDDIGLLLNIPCPFTSAFDKSIPCYLAASLTLTFSLSF